MRWLGAVDASLNARLPDSSRSWSKNVFRWRSSTSRPCCSAVGPEKGAQLVDRVGADHDLVAESAALGGGIVDDVFGPAMLAGLSKYSRPMVRSMVMTQSPDW